MVESSDHNGPEDQSPEVQGPGHGASREGAEQWIPTVPGPVRPPPKRASRRPDLIAAAAGVGVLVLLLAFAGGYFARGGGGDAQAERDELRATVDELTAERDGFVDTVDQCRATMEGFVEYLDEVEDFEGDIDEFFLAWEGYLLTELDSPEEAQAGEHLDQVGAHIDEQRDKMLRGSGALRSEAQRC